MKRYENPETSTIKRVFRKYKINAKKRNLEFNIQFDLFKDVVKQDCFYCSREPRFLKLTPRSSRGAYINGVDRYYNNRGYVADNIRPCCSSCNYLKGSLDGDDFIAKVKLIVEVIHGRTTTEINNNNGKEIQG